jgi:hypothetical protein
MDDLAFVRSRIESYADYTNDDDRRLVDEQVRAYVGEALARLRERLNPSGPPGELLEGVLLRCQFANQPLVRALDMLEPDAAEIAALHERDRELITLADGADAVTADGVSAYLQQIETQLDARSKTIIDDAPVV